MLRTIFVAALLAGGAGAATAADSGALWDLRCAVREEMVRWAQSLGPLALPRTRVDVLRD